MSDIDGDIPPFDQFGPIRRLSSTRSGHASREHVRHHLYVARDKRSRANVLIKVTSKPGVVYERNLENEIATLSRINRELPDSRHFPLLGEHGRLRDGRMFLTMSCFDEWPLATTIAPERIPARHVMHIRTAIEVASTVNELHGLQIWHVDLNPMNILFRWEQDTPVIRIVDFESSYEVARHANGVFYNPPTTPGFTAPELSRQPPDARADVFSLGAVLFTMHAGYEWTLTPDVGRAVAGDPEMASELKEIVARAVEPDPGGRYSCLAELRTALVEYLERIWPGRRW